MLLGLLTATAVLSLFGLAASASQLWPKNKLAFYAETLVELVVNLFADSFSSRQKALRHLPLLLSLFVFILASNLSGLLPGVGSVTVQTADGQAPLLRAFTTDLNATLALALLSIGAVQFYALRELGLRGHLRHYFSGQPWKPMNLFIGLNEVFSELLRIVTLSMRLFGVIYAGEVLLNAIAGLSGNLAWAATLPIMLLEIFFSLIQAYLFMMLTTVYLAVATQQDEHGQTDPAAAAAEDPLTAQKGAKLQWVK